MEYLLASLCLSSLQSSPLWQEASATEEGRTDEGDATEPLLQGIDGEAGMGDGDLAGAENKQNKKKKVWSIPIVFVTCFNSQCYLFGIALCLAWQLTSCAA
jgi:hypothetical protein